MGAPAMTVGPRVATVDLWGNLSFVICQVPFIFNFIYLVLTPRKKRNIPPFAGVVWEALAHPPQNKEFSTFSRGTRVSSSRQLLNVSSFQAHS